jgi:hypothetical protein
MSTSQGFVLLPVYQVYLFIILFYHFFIYLHVYTLFRPPQRFRGEGLYKYSLSYLLVHRCISYPILPDFWLLQLIYKATKTGFIL